MAQVRLSEEAYQLLKARAKREKRTLSAVLEMLLVDTTPTGSVWHTAAAGDPGYGFGERSLEPGEEHLFSSPLDAQGIPPDSVKGKASARPATLHGLDPAAAHVLAEALLHPKCTCGPGERAKGKHSKYCPMRKTCG